MPSPAESAVSPSAPVPARARSRTRECGPRPRLFTVKEFERLYREGLLRPDERLELIEGEIVRMAPIGVPHVWVVQRLDRVFQAVLHESGAPVFSQAPLFLDRHSQPQPDLMILRGDVREWDARVPTAADALLVVEVSDSSLAQDLGTKARLYAKHGVPEYWVFDLGTGRVVVHRDPSRTGYRTIREARAPDVLSPLAFPHARIDLAEVLRGCVKDPGSKD